MSLFKNPHANQRYFERVPPDIASKKDIVKAIQHPSNIEYIKKLTESRSMAYVHLPNDNVVKVIINKNKKELVTILPWKDIYKIEMEIFIHFNGHYKVELYPDCYLETGNISTLNKVYRVIMGEVVAKIPYNEIEFEPTILKAWEKYEKTKSEEETKENCTQ